MCTDSEEEEVRDEQGRILHSYLSKEELAAVQEALAEENTLKLDAKQIVDLKEVMCSVICTSHIFTSSL